MTGRLETDPHQLEVVIKVIRLIVMTTLTFQERRYACSIIVDNYMWLQMSSNETHVG